MVAPAGSSEAATEGADARTMASTAASTTALEVCHHSVRLVMLTMLRYRPVAHKFGLRRTGDAR